ncbi:Multidrug resistance-associated protein/mitoxantrone resistance protein, ABC superfamily [Phaffia rhodozyma]|uniref:Multidrug resistance-associated protein/mitoxantrone resistance protein, ABC superfamily n=1 Tax=Phaffia rhodozyma TaxID=264483 RepID=A0A0F7SXS3_PHARH|nr:Multidrug resistance-associated protein/mitoxantrone resistance protein, ABC superfamily [Phaffia rhodozyma]
MLSSHGYGHDSKLSYINPGVSFIVLYVIPSLLTIPRVVPSKLSYYLFDIPLKYLGRDLTLKDLYPDRNTSARGLPVWKVTVLTLGGLGLTLCYGARACWAFWSNISAHRQIAGADAALGICWLYTAIYPTLYPKQTLYLIVFVFHILQFVLSCLTLIALFLKPSLSLPVFIPHDPTLRQSEIVLSILSAVVSAALIIVSLSSPVETLPASYEREKQVEIEGKNHMGPSPEDGCSLWGWISFNWVKPLISKGSSGYMKDSDVYTLSPTQRSKPLYQKFKETARLGLLRRLCMAHGFDLSMTCVLTFVAVMLQYTAPYLIKQIIEALADSTPEKISSAYLYAGLALLVSFLKAQADLNHLWLSRRACVRIKSQLGSAIYEKALKRKDKSGVFESDGSAGTGKIVNLMSGDATEVAYMVTIINRLYGAPFEIIVCCTFLYTILSWSAFAGLLILIAVMPLNTVVSRSEVKIEKEMLDAKDKRINITNELVDAIKFIKFFAWERQWNKRVTDARQVELNVMIRARINATLFQILWSLTPMLVTIVSFLSFIILEHGELTVGVAFTAISLFSMLLKYPLIRLPLNIVPMTIVSLFKAHVAVKRVDDFLNEDEVPDFVSSLKEVVNPALRDPTDDTIGFVGGTFRWTTGVSSTDKRDSPSAPATISSPTSDVTESSTTPTVRFELTDLSFVFPTGKLTIVTGHTGAGKSALLYALLGEMETIKGNILLPKNTTVVDKHGLTNSISYAGQKAWLQNMSIKENILFSSPLDKKRYTDVLKACCLGPDLKMLEDGDDTEIGAKGVSLSGGQKARVALARAIYSRAKHILLDDPFAAVDSHTAAALVADCLAGPFCANRTVIIVSHHVELLLPTATCLIRLVEGRVEAQGTIAELRAAGHLAEIVATEQKEVPDESSVMPKDGSTAEEIAAVEGEDTADELAEPKNKARKMVEDEEREVGNIGWSTYSTYFRARSWWLWAINVVLLFLSANTDLVERWWIKEWTNAYSESVQQPRAYIPTDYLSIPDQSSQSSFYLPAGMNTTVSQPVEYGTLTKMSRPSANEHPLYYLGIYAAISLGFAVLVVVRGVIGFWGSYRASKTLHAQMLSSVIRATTRWFDVTPSGRIVNRFSRDQGTIDREVSDSLEVVVDFAFALLGAVALIGSIVPWFLVPATVLGYCYWRFSVDYIRCGRDLKRMEATAQSPIFSGFSETLEGVVTIRAFSSEKRFMENLQTQIDKASACFYFIWMLNRWLFLRFDCLGGIAIFATSILTLQSGVSGGWGGMAILSSQGFVMAVYWLCRYWSELEMQMNSVERVNDYLNIPQEPPNIIEGHRPPAYWPSHSSETLIHVEDLVVSYSPELPPVVHGISFDIRPREKIGLIGRTGSGKSTLGMSLLRFSDPISGKILIDGIDITSIGLEDLRSKITIIPQDAVLFSGTIRDNLDPFKEHDDATLLEALERVQLGKTRSFASSQVSSNSNLVGIEQSMKDGALKANSEESNAIRANITLDTEVSTGGANFSQGQRQLLAMCRALLRNSSIIIMDEATASVDFETDNILQKTIREEFKDSCLITIAHRLTSIIDYDRLLVLDHGRLKEFASPYELLTKPQVEMRAKKIRTGQVRTEELCFPCNLPVALLIHGTLDHLTPIPIIPSHPIQLFMSASSSKLRVKSLIAWVCITSLIFGFHISALNASQSTMICDGPESSQDSPRPSSACISTIQFGYLTSAYTLGGLFGLILVPFLPKTNSKLIIRPLLGWSLVTLSGELIQIYTTQWKVMAVGRAVIGIGAMGGIACVPPALASLSVQGAGGKVGVLHQLGIVLGILFAQSLGLYYHGSRKAILYVSIIVSVFQIFSSVFLPDPTSLQLGEKNTTPSADASLSEEEEGLLSASERVEHGTEDEVEQVEVEEDRMEVWEMLKEKEIRRGVVVVISAMSLQQLSGINAVMFYSTSILAPLFPSSANLLAVYITAFNVLLTFPSIILIDSLGRKTLLVGSALGMALSASLLGWGLNEQRGDIAAIGVFGFVGCQSLGLGPVPYVLVGELVPVRARAALSSTALLLNTLSNLLVGVLFLPIQKALSKTNPQSDLPEGTGNVFGLFAACLILGAVGLIKGFRSG